MTRLLALTSALAILSATVAHAQSPPAFPPPMPKAFPPTDEAAPITGAFLQDPLVTDALAYVQKVVPAQYLNIAPSTYKSPCVATYSSVAAANANCYWPQGLCTRNADTPAFRADISECPGANQWGITYDDGPISNNGVKDTTALIAALKTANVKSTFFIVGSNGIQHPELVAAGDKDGHQIAGHTWTHYPLTSLTNAQVVAELKYTEAMIYQAIGKVPTMFRPPCGDIDDRVRAIASALGYRSVLWNPQRDDQAADVTNQTPQESATLLATVKTWFKPQAGFVSLSHDIDEFTTGLGLDTLAAISAQANFPLKPQPVGTCMNLPFYRSGNNNTVASSVSSVSSATATVMSTSSTAAAVSTPTTTTIIDVVASATAGATPTVAAGSSSGPSSSASPAPSAGAGTTVTVQSGASAVSVKVAGLAAAAGLVAFASLL